MIYYPILGCPEPFEAAANGNCYLKSREVMTRPEAQRWCCQQGGYLVQINDGHENTVVSKLKVKRKEKL